MNQVIHFILITNQKKTSFNEERGKRILNSHNWVLLFFIKKNIGTIFQSGTILYFQSNQSCQRVLVFWPSNENVQKILKGPKFEDIFDNYFKEFQSCFIYLFFIYCGCFFHLLFIFKVFFCCWPLCRYIHFLFYFLD